MKKLIGLADAFGDKLKGVDIEALIGALGTIKETSPEKIVDSIIKNKEDHDNITKTLYNEVYKPRLDEINNWR